MLIKTPPSLHYPVTVTELLVQRDDTVERFAPLFSYTYETTVTEGKDKVEVKKTFPARFESEIEGKLVEWRIRKTDIITGPRVIIAEIVEPCIHEVQFGGMCVNCGKDMTEVNYATTSLDTNRATINMTHDRTELKISNDEAKRINESARRRLIASKKLSLVVDLDQTIIHATVDPTVAEWRDDPENPNHGAVKDVRSFQLIDEGPGARGCWYHIKLRPGLKEFLENTAKLYELHIYTMGTRAYAQNIAKIIDPDRKIFGDRILSRDESGSMTVKNLHRLFPVDTNMVVIIDDRGDVWHWSNNLIKVKAYDFFVGIGDINSSFLPKRLDVLTEPVKLAEQQMDSVETKPLANGVSAPTAASVPPSDSKAPSGADGGTSNLEQQLVAMAGGDDPRTIEKQSSDQEEVIAHQVEDRPLLQMQKRLEQKEEQEADGKSDATTQAEKQQGHILRDDDKELHYLEQNLAHVHDAFYDAYEKALAGSQGGRVAQLRGEKGLKVPPKDNLQLVPDVQDIMPHMKRNVLAGVVIVYSGVIPLGANHMHHDWTIWAKSFGARVSETLTKATTHLVATPDRRTLKVKQAARHPKINVVTTDWLFECFTAWKRVDEEPYLIVPPEAERGTHVPGGDSLPLEEPDESLPLSTDDDDLEDERLSLALPDETDDGASDEPESPVKLGLEVWDEVDDEVQQYLDASDSEEDGDDDRNDPDYNEGTESDSSSKSDGGRKRKRSTDSTETSDAEESDAGNTTGSKLQKRKRRALERTTGLANVTSAKDSSGLPSPDTTGPDEEDEAAVDAEDGNDDDFDEAALEAEMMAALESDSGDEVES